MNPKRPMSGKAIVNEHVDEFVIRYDSDHIVQSKTQFQDVNSNHDFLKNSSDIIFTPSSSSECSIGIQNQSNFTGVCSAPPDLQVMVRFLHKFELVDDSTFDFTNERNVVNKLCQILKCNKESEIYLHPLFQQFYARDRLQQRFLPEGPIKADQMLSDEDIEQATNSWMKDFPDYVACKVQYIDFIDDYDETTKTCKLFQQYDFTKMIVRDGKRIFSIPMNKLPIDASPSEFRNHGHWFTLLLNFRNLTNQDIQECLLRRKQNELSTTAEQYVRYTKQCTLTYFNSSGRVLFDHPQILKFFDLLQSKLEQDLPGINMWQLGPCLKRHQYTSTPCGMYVNAAFILTSLRGIPWTYFTKYRITDQDMNDARRLIFRAREKKNTRQKYEQRIDTFLSRIKSH